MTRREAERKARDLWQGGFAVRVPEQRRHLRFVVGVRMGSAVPLGVGDSFEAAFSQAAEAGFTAEKLAEAWKQYVDATADAKARALEMAQLAARRPGKTMTFLDEVGTVEWDEIDHERRTVTRHRRTNP